MRRWADQGNGGGSFEGRWGAGCCCGGWSCCCWRLVLGAGGGLRGASL